MGALLLEAAFVGGGAMRVVWLAWYICGVKPLWAGLVAVAVTVTPLLVLVG